VNRALLVATVVLAIVVVMFSVASYPALPAQIPTHFGPAGADHWAAKTPARWFLVPLLALGLCALNYVIGAVFAKRPEYMNIPRKQRLLALAPEQRARVMRWWWVLIQTIGVAELLLLSVAQYGLWRAASAQAYEGWIVGILVGFIALSMLPVTLLIVWRMSEEIAKQERGGE
jgi:uncharacterized membrane protein